MSSFIDKISALGFASGWTLGFIAIVFYHNILLGILAIITSLWIANCHYQEIITERNVNQRKPMKR